MGQLKTEYYFFNLQEYGRVYTLIDFGNVRPWAKEFWPEENKFRLCQEIDISKLAKVCDWVNPVVKKFYYGYFGQNLKFDINHENNKKHRDSIFRINKARKNGFKVSTKEIKMIPHYDDEGKFLGKFPKCNFDVEITMDLIREVENYDTVMLFSGDSDFGGLLKYLKSLGKKVVIVCTRRSMSTELEEVAHKYIPAKTLKDLLMYKNVSYKTTLRP